MQKLIRRLAAVTVCGLCLTANAFGQHMGDEAVIASSLHTTGTDHAKVVEMKISGRLAAGCSVSMQSHEGRPIVADAETWVLIHGNASDHRRMRPLAKAIIQHSATSSPQVLLLDWSDAARADWSACGKAERHIDDVADWAYERLRERQFEATRIRLIGHSFGAYVADRIAARYGRVASIIALDPAIDVPAVFPFGGSAKFNPRVPGTVDFASHSVRSWSFRVLDSPFGLDHTTFTAHENYLIDGTDHSSVVDCLANLLSLGEADPVGSRFLLQRLGEARQVGDWEYDLLVVTAPTREQPKSSVVVAPSGTVANFDAHLLVDAHGEIAGLQFVRRGEAAAQLAFVRRDRFALDD